MSVPPVPDPATRPVVPSPEAGFGPILPAPAPARPLRQQVFECVRGAGLIARSEVARRLMVSPGTVSAIASDLIAQGWLGETPLPRTDGEQPRGRPPVALSVAPEAGRVAGIKLSNDAHSAVVMDFAGRPLAEGRLACPPGPRPLARLIEETAAVLSATLSDAGLRPTDLAAVGIGVSGVVNHDSGTVLWSPLIAERGTALRAGLERRLGLPVTIDNDVNVLTLAELWFGAGRSRADFAVITIEHGVGMGLVVDHRIHRGASGLGMELGHTKVAIDGALCRCGRHGCLEAYVADYALLREAATALGRDTGALPGPQMLESLRDHAKAGHPAARAIFARAGRYMAMGLANVVNLFDPSLILLSGERMRHDFLYADAVVAEMRRLMLDIGRPAPELRIHAWGDGIWARGAATLALAERTEAALQGDSA